MTGGWCGVGFRLAVVIATGGLSAFLTVLAIRYAMNRRLLDLPGQRRSHAQPTPRGGGIAIVVAMLAGGLALAIGEGRADRLPLLLPPVIGVAWVGWLDDHGGLSALKRLAMHWVAAVWVFAGPLLLITVFPLADVDVSPLVVITASMVTLWIAWSINLHNFMDGIDGLLTLQAMFVLLALSAFALLRGVEGSAFLLVGAAACAGFLPFNFPRARIFMGDVGSGVLGFVIGIGVLWQIANPRIAATTGLILCSAFVTDATCTLLSRVLRGRRWYSAHREHLYQWLVRSDFSHAQVVGLYMAWNLLLALPVAYWMNRPTAASSLAASLAGFAFVYVSALTAWCLGKRWCLRRVRLRSLSCNCAS